jgi:hypothetical protein
MRHSRWQYNRISLPQIHEHIIISFWIQRSSPEQQSTMSLEHSIAFMRHRMEVMGRIVFKHPAFDPVVGLDSRTC